MKLLHDIMITAALKLRKSQFSIRLHGVFGLEPLWHQNLFD